MFSVCISTLVHIVLVCNLNTVQTRCCSPQSVSLQAGRPVHCADMDSWSCWYSLLLHLTPGHRDTCSLMYSLYLSTFSQIGGQKRRREPNWDCASCVQLLQASVCFVVTYTRRHVQIATALVTLSPSGPRWSGGAVEVNHGGIAWWWG